MYWPTVCASTTGPATAARSAAEDAADHKPIDNQQYTMHTVDKYYIKQPCQRNVLNINQVAKRAHTMSLSQTHLPSPVSSGGGEQETVL